MIEVTIQVFGLSVAVAMALFFMRRQIGDIERRLEHMSHKIESLHRCTIERGEHHPASDPDPIAIVERDEPTEPTHLPRATARTRSKSP